MLVQIRHVRATADLRRESRHDIFLIMRRESVVRPSDTAVPALFALDSSNSPISPGTIRVAVRSSGMPASASISRRVARRGVIRFVHGRRS